MLSRSIFNIQKRGFASKLMAGSTNNKKDSAGRRLGVKRSQGSEVRRGEILLKQRGFKWHPGNHVYSGKDHTLHTETEGVVTWAQDKYAYKRRKRINVIPQETPNRKFPPPPSFVYHPEIFPELAKYNPSPANLEIPRA